MRMAGMMLVAAGAIGAAAPGAAQIAGRVDYGPVGIADPLITDGRLPGPAIGRELGHIREEISQAREAGLLSRREARQFRREASRIGHLAERYAGNGLSQAEQQELTHRALALRGLVNRPAAKGR
jgi:hypothetical protein